jgi:hypothetical protein
MSGLAVLALSIDGRVGGRDRSARMAELVDKQVDCPGK